MEPSERAGMAIQDPVFVSGRRPRLGSLTPWALAVGAGFMFGRTIVLIGGGALATYTRWCAGLLVLESIVDLMALITVVAWGLKRGARAEAIAMRAVASVVILHAIRVLVFVLGRTGPWIDFDIRLEHRVAYADQWTWAGVVFAAVMAALSLIVLAVVWRARRAGR